VVCNATNITAQCNSCGVELFILRIPANYFFICIACRAVGNLPGLLAAFADATIVDENARIAELNEIREQYPIPDEPPPNVEQFRKG